jgi:hypothetical protein
VEQAERAAGRFGQLLNDRRGGPSRWRKGNTDRAQGTDRACSTRPKARSSGKSEHAAIDAGVGGITSRRRPQELTRRANQRHKIIVGNIAG